jgi:hypothetical protein
MLQKIWSCRKDHRKEELQNDYRKEDHQQGRDAYQFSKDRMICFFFFFFLLKRQNYILKCQSVLKIVI